jgi:tRNA G18 (ribose-2'-O)-methylase SpoU
LPNELVEACAERVLIPMTGQVESLNVAVAASIAMYQANLKA